MKEAIHSCYHCGDSCESGVIRFEDHDFCCTGCRSVFEILKGANMNAYYQLESSPGMRSADFGNKQRFAYLDLPDIIEEYLQFREGNQAKITLNLPQIHCSSCIWLLEHLSRLTEGVQYSQVNFSARSAHISFDIDKISLRQLVELLDSIGYTPDLYVSRAESRGTRQSEADLYVPLGSARGTASSPRLRSVSNNRSRFRSSSGAEMNNNGAEMNNGAEASNNQSRSSSALRLRSARVVEMNKRLIYQIGLSGFCFGNIMLLAFPEYLGIDESYGEFRSFFGYISMFLAIPVLLYGGQDYLKDAWHGLRQRYINMDVPIALGMLTLFIRSSYEVLTQTGAGYFDSLAGLVFFLLLGKWFQRKTYDHMSFDRDYKSYFPIAVNRKEGENFVPVRLEAIKVGDALEIRNNELIPVDSVLKDGEALIDYSFVTGESKPIRKQLGDKLYAGGKQLGSRIEIEAKGLVDNSYLTQLWNQEVFTKKRGRDLHGMTNSISAYFTLIVLGITLITAIYWYFTDISLVWNAVTAVLIVACPCALALSVPFAEGNAIRLMGKMGLFMKNAAVVEDLAKVTTIVLDKTGTITYSQQMEVNYKGAPLNDTALQVVKSICSNSIHPLSVAIAEHLPNIQKVSVDGFKEITGKGVTGSVNGLLGKLGSEAFAGSSNSKSSQRDQKGSTRVYVQIDGEVLGYFELRQEYRQGLKAQIAAFQQFATVHVLSGDDNEQEGFLGQEMGISHLQFNQSPMDKLAYIKTLQANGEKVLMIGDGLNDAGALKQSDVGIAIADNLHQFSPACDAILQASSFSKLSQFISAAKNTLKVIYASFGISFLYNIIGLSFAISGHLSPIVAAILMPLSSITVVVFGTAATRLVISRKSKAYSRGLGV